MEGVNSATEGDALQKHWSALRRESSSMGHKLFPIAFEVEGDKLDAEYKTDEFGRPSFAETLGDTLSPKRRSSSTQISSEYLRNSNGRRTSLVESRNSNSNASARTSAALPRSSQSSHGHRRLEHGLDSSIESLEPNEPNIRYSYIHVPNSARFPATGESVLASFSTNESTPSQSRRASVSRRHSAVMSKVPENWASGKNSEQLPISLGYTDETLSTYEAIKVELVQHIIQIDGGPAPMYVLSPSRRSSISLPPTSPLFQQLPDLFYNDESEELRLAKIRASEIADDQHFISRRSSVFGNENSPSFGMSERVSGSARHTARASDASEGERRHSIRSSNASSTFLFPEYEHHFEERCDDPTRTNTQVRSRSRRGSVIRSNEADAPQRLSTATSQQALGAGDRHSYSRRGSLSYATDSGTGKSSFIKPFNGSSTQAGEYSGVSQRRLSSTPSGVPEPSTSTARRRSTSSSLGLGEHSAVVASNRRSSVTSFGPAMEQNPANATSRRPSVSSVVSFQDLNAEDGFHRRSTLPESLANLDPPQCTADEQASVSATQVAKEVDLFPVHDDAAVSVADGLAPKKSLAGNSQDVLQPSLKLRRSSFSGRTLPSEALATLFTASGLNSSNQRLALRRGSLGGRPVAGSFGQGDSSSHEDFTTSVRTLYENANFCIGAHYPGTTVETTCGAAREAPSTREGTFDGVQADALGLTGVRVAETSDGQSEAPTAVIDAGESLVFYKQVETLGGDAYRDGLEASSVNSVAGMEEEIPLVTHYHVHTESGDDLSASDLALTSSARHFSFGSNERHHFDYIDSTGGTEAAPLKLNAVVEEEEGFEDVEELNEAEASGLLTAGSVTRRRSAADDSGLADEDAGFRLKQKSSTTTKGSASRSKVRCNSSSSLSASDSRKTLIKSSNSSLHSSTLKILGSLGIFIPTREFADPVSPSKDDLQRLGVASCYKQVNLFGYDEVFKGRSDPLLEPPAFSPSDSKPHAKGMWLSGSIDAALQSGKKFNWLASLKAELMASLRSPTAAVRTVCTAELLFPTRRRQSLALAKNQRRAAPPSSSSVGVGVKATLSGTCASLPKLLDKSASVSTTNINHRLRQFGPDKYSEKYFKSPRP